MAKSELELRQELAKVQHNKHFFAVQSPNNPSDQDLKAKSFFRTLTETRQGWVGVVFRKLIRWFNERVLGFVYYEMEVRKYDMVLFGKENYTDYSGEVITKMHKHFEFAPTEKELETKMKKVVNTFEGTPINKIKFVINYV